MRPIPPKHRQVIDSDKYYKTCARKKDGNCDGRITIEHSLIYASRQICELWSYVPLCEYHHAVNQYMDSGDLDKNKNIWIALNRATDLELEKYYKANYKQLRERLNKIYGTRG